MGTQSNNIDGIRDLDGKETGNAYAFGLLTLGGLLFFCALLLRPSIVDHVLSNILLELPDVAWVLGWLHPCGVGLGVFLIIGHRRLGRSSFAIWLFASHGWLGGALVSLLLSLLLCQMMELAFWRFQVASSGPLPKLLVGQQYDPNLTRFDPLLGVRSGAMSEVRHRAIARPAGRVLFEKVYTTDVFGNRTVPQSDTPKDIHLAMFGCSFVYGIGCNDDETFPAQLACEHPEVNVYNFAQGGYGPGQALLQIQSGALDVIAERLGVAVFRFMGDHVNRLLPKPDYIERWTANHPAFRLNEKGEPVYLGPLKEVFSEQLRFYALLRRENFVRWQNISFPLFIGKEDLALTAAILGSARAEYRLRFPDNEFYVLIDPIYHLSFDSQQFVGLLRDRGVPVLASESIYPEQEWENLVYEMDLHPTPEAHAILAAWFWEQFPDGLLAGPHALEYLL